MTFKFKCPAGHVLEAEPQHAGRACQCPHCGVTMRVPPAPVTVAPVIKIAGKESEYRQARWQNSTSEPVENPFPVESISDVFHIPCPNGHPLETLPEMLGRWAMCPQCEAKFKLDRKDSVEFREFETQRLERKEAELSRRWLNGTIVAMVLTLLGVVLLFLLASAN